MLARRTACAGRRPGLAAIAAVTPARLVASDPAFTPR
jgi:hypothetical protein